MNWCMWLGHKLPPGIRGIWVAGQTAGIQFGWCVRCKRKVFVGLVRINRKVSHVSVDQALDVMSNGTTPTL